MVEKSDIHIRIAARADRAAMMPAINQAFAIEKFLEGTRTDEARLTEMMESGEFLIAQNGSGKIVASVYVEIKGKRGYLGMLAVDPAEQGKGFGRVMVDAVEEYCRKEGCSGVDLVSSICGPTYRLFTASWDTWKRPSRNFTLRAN